ncbi:MAG: gephyrin-like molybdotransferase Glp [Chloroflexota bacterium]
MEDISFAEAYRITMSGVVPLSAVSVSVISAVGRVVVDDIVALATSPDSDVSLKDGYAVRSADVSEASESTPIILDLQGTLMAGGVFARNVPIGAAVRIMSGAALPTGTDAVVSQEFSSDDGKYVSVVRHVAKGQNVLPRGTDVESGEVVMEKGTMLGPAHLGLAVAAGLSSVRVHRRPVVALVATGDELLAPGASIEQGKIFASNLVSVAAWCDLFGFAYSASVIADEEGAIASAVRGHAGQVDCLVTSGGAWKGERDLIVQVLEMLGWEQHYHRVRMGPGKAVGFGFLDGTAVFCLPGGPPSNQTAFIQLVLPALMRMSGSDRMPLPVAQATLAQEVKGQSDWAQFIYGGLTTREGILTFVPVAMQSRLRAMAEADGLISIPEGVESIHAGARVDVQVLPFRSGDGLKR